MSDVVERLTRLAEFLVKGADNTEYHGPKYPLLLPDGSTLQPTAARVLSVKLRGDLERHKTVLVAQYCEQCVRPQPCPDLLSWLPVADAILGEEQGHA